MIEALALTIFPALMVVIAIYDLSTMTIPNWVSLCLVFGFFTLAILSGMAWPEIGVHTAIAGGILLITFTLFSLGYIGGGDAKVMAASSLWVGWNLLLPYFLIVTILGGGLTLALLFFRKIPLPAALISQTWISRLHEHDGGIPYGIAIAVGGLIVFTDSLVFRVSVM